MKKIIAMLSIAALVLTVSAPAFATEDHELGSDTVKVTVSNSATVVNTISANSSTGGNDADGGDGGRGGRGGRGGDYAGDGGDVEYGYFGMMTGGDGGNTGSGGNGGNGGEGGDAGDITTGDAETGVILTNYVNTTDIDVASCGCDETSESLALLDALKDKKTKVKVENAGVVVNDVDANAKTGYNDTDGGDGGNGGKGGRGGDYAGDGGDVEGSRHSRHGDSWYLLLLTGDNSQTGGNGGTTGDGWDGGNGGMGGEGGSIDTGSATTNVDALTDANNTVIRVRR